ncbi:MAG: hypothetical protein J5I62_00375 [Flavobacteriales bacterium]|nr:hypothetical protein [Flavobacteriales bacterium]MEB2342471.1 hypothetical protein [Flavobacteriia bacterium]
MKYLPVIVVLVMACGQAPEVHVVKDRAGLVRAEVTRVHGMKDGPVRLYHDDGSLEAEGRYVKDKRQGTWTSFGPSGDTLAMGTYRDGLKDGPQAYWAPNGQLLRFERFQKGVSHGPLYRFYADGSPRQLTWYDDGVAEGRYIEWFKVDATSVGLMFGQFHKGERTGRWTWFYANGKPNRQGRYIAGRPVGVWRYWKPDGSLANTKDFGP